MKTCLSLCALGLGLACSLAAVAGAEPGPAASNDIKDIVFFSQTRPVLIRLHVRVDGKPYSAAWETYVHELFNYLDRNGDGVLGKE